MLSNLSMLEILLNDYNKYECAIYNYFNIQDGYRNYRVVLSEIQNYYWYIDEDKSLNYAETKEEIQKDGGYSLDGYDCDEAVQACFEKDNYVAVIIGCCEHKAGELWIMRKDRCVEFEEDE